MAQQLLHDLQLCTGRSKQRRIGMTKSMPGNSFGDSQLSRDGKNMALHDLLCKVRPAALIRRTREYPTFLTIDTASAHAIREEPSSDHREPAQASVNSLSYKRQ